MAKYNEPLGLPQGTVRGIITILLILSAIGMEILGKNSLFIIAQASMALGYYFGNRSEETIRIPRTETEHVPTMPAIEDDEPDDTRIIPGGSQSDTPSS